MNGKRRCMCLLLLACVPIAAAGETESFWIGDGTDFDDPLSWNGPVPDETVACIFDIDAKLGPFAFFQQDAVSGRLIVRAGNPYFLMWDNDGQGGNVSRNYGVVNPSFNTPSVVVAENALETATLHLDEGFLNAQSVVLGMGAGSYGALEFGTGLFGLTAGLSCVYELHVGGAGQGLLTIDDGVVVTAAETVIGVAAGSLGDVILTNPDSILDVAGPLTVGKQGQGFLTVDDLADLVSTSALIGMSPGSQGVVTVTGQGASWTNDGSLDVGFQGQGTLAVTGGAAVFTHGFAAIGTLPEPAFPPVTGGVGDVTIDGPASLWLVDGDLYVGLLWFGTLDILGGATVTSQTGIVGLSGEPGVVANVEGPGSVWATIDDITVFSGSLLRVVGGAIVLASVVDVAGELDADGTIVGELDSGGTIRVGDPVGMLAVDGDMTTGGALLLDLGGPDPGDFDAVGVSGTATVGGALTVALVGGYDPQAGDAFQVIAAAAVDGGFDTVTLPDLGPGLTWLFAQSADSIDLVVTTDVPGDLNGDGLVGINDFLLLLAAWGPCPAPPVACPADLNGDGAVGINDMLILLALWS